MTDKEMSELRWFGKEALPRREGEEGSERQICAENAFYVRAEALGLLDEGLETWLEHATTQEGVRRVLRRAERIAAEHEDDQSESKEGKKARRKQRHETVWNCRNIELVLDEIHRRVMRARPFDPTYDHDRLRELLEELGRVSREFRLG